MIIPTKYMDLERCTLAQAAAILGELRTARAMPVADLEGLMESTKAVVDSGSIEVALVFLYAVGLVEYDPHTDALVLTQVGHGPTR